ncbi:MAG TPA: hypothetical protein VL360_05775 [Gammaproteobacteria bacterium]|jgi:hypothetical protein|nr:hypothetical protein [Gammaproteobacteria bacterium]
MLPRLDDLLEYQHEKVVRSYIRTFNCDESVARGLFSDMLRYLWLARKHTLDRLANPEDDALQFQLVMHEEMRQIDNMWHNFIIYTHDYMKFCDDYFGEYLHHVPDMADAISQTNEEFAVDMEKYLSYVYDRLGEETVCRWFAMHV